MHSMYTATFLRHVSNICDLKVSFNLYKKLNDISNKYYISSYFKGFIDIY